MGNDKIRKEMGRKKKGEKETVWLNSLDSQQSPSVTSLAVSIFKKCS